MLFNPEHSTCSINQSIVVSKENKNEHIIRNESKSPIFQYHIDGGIICDNRGERCDYIVEVQKNEPIAFIIELKGSDQNKAISQIEATIKRFSQLNSYSLFPRIVIHKGRTHSINSKIRRDFFKKYPTAIIKELKHEDTV